MLIRRIFPVDDPDPEFPDAGPDFVVHGVRCDEQDALQFLQPFAAEYDLLGYDIHYFKRSNGLLFWKTVRKT